MISLLEVGFIASAGVLAGGLNAVAGGGTLISFPALLATGMPAVVANITSSVGLVSGYLGGAVGYRRELQGQGRRARSLAGAAVLGGAAGAVILLLTPEDSFRMIVPYLVLASCGVLAVQPRLAAWVAARGVADPEARKMTPALQIGVFAAAVYGSYFGAGLGVLLLGVLGVLLQDHLQRLNGLKTLLALIVNLVGVTIFVFSGRVDWVVALVLLISAYLGGLSGARLARRLTPRVLRTAVITFGVGVSIALIIQG